MLDWAAMLVGLSYIPAVLVKTTALLACAWCVHGALRGRNPRWRVLLWRAAVVALVVLPFAEWALPRLEVAVMEESAPPPTAAPVTTEAISPPLAPFAPTHSAVPVVAPSPIEPALPTFSIKQWLIRHYAALLCAAWALIALALLVGVLRAWLRVHTTIARSVAAPAEVCSVADRIGRELGVTARLDVRVVEQLGSPFLTGVRSPIIVLPERCLQESDAAQLRAVLAHELAHVKTRDPFWMTFARFAATLLWFHPLMWRVRSAHNGACEDVCDGVAAAYLGSPETYSKALAREALALLDARPVPGGVPMIRSAEIIHRLRKIERGIRANPLARRWVAVSLLAGAALLAALGSLRLVQAQPAGTETAQTGSPNAVETTERVLRFPKDRALGSLSVREPGIEGWKGWVKVGLAQGDITVPAGKDVRLEMTDRAFENLPSLKELEPDTLQELYLGSESLSDDDLRYVGGLTGLHSLFLSSHPPNGKPCPLTGEGLRHLSGLKDLREILFGGTCVDDASLESLKDLQKLEFVHFSWCRRLNGSGLAHLMNLPSLRCLDFHMTPITDEGLATIEGHPTLDNLSLQSTGVTNTGVAYLKTMPRLRIVVLPPSTDDAGLAKLVGLDLLEEIRLSDTAVTDEGLAILKSFPKLRSVHISSMNPPIVTGPGLAYLQALPNLQALHLFLRNASDETLEYLDGLHGVQVNLHVSSFDITDKGMEHLAGFGGTKLLTIGKTAVTDAGLANLKGMDILTSLRASDTAVGDVGVSYLAGLPNLESLWLENTAITDVACEYFQSLPSLRQLRLQGTATTDAGLVHLGKVATLYDLDLGATLITDDGLASLKELAQLRQLSLRDTRISDAGLEHLRALTALTDLYLERTRVTQAGVDALQDALPYCSIHYEAAGRPGVLNPAAPQPSGVTEGTVRFDHHSDSPENIPSITLPKPDFVSVGQSEADDREGPLVAPESDADSRPEPAIGEIIASINSADAMVKSLEFEVELFLGVESFDADTSSLAPNAVITHIRKDSEYLWARRQFSEEKLITDDVMVFDGKLYKTLDRGSATAHIDREEHPAYRSIELASPTRVRVWDEKLVVRLARDEVVLLPTKGDVNGVDCLVLEGRVDVAPDLLLYRLYLDPNIGFLPRQIDEISAGDPRGLARRARLMQYEEVEPGIWFAMRMEEEGHDRSSGEVFTNNIYSTRYVRVNQPIADDALKVEFPVGTAVLDKTTDSRYVVEGNGVLP